MIINKTIGIEISAAVVAAESDRPVKRAYSYNVPHEISFAIVAIYNLNRVGEILVHLPFGGVWTIIGGCEVVCVLLVCVLLVDVR